MNFQLLVEFVRFGGADFDVLTELFQLTGVVAILVGSKAPPQLTQFFRNFAVTGRLDCLAANRIQLNFHFVDNVGQAKQVLVDSVQPSGGFDFSRLEPANASRFFENQTATRCIRLKNLVDSTLFDNAVGRSTSPGSQEQVTNVFETCRGSVDKILGVTVSPKTTPNLYLCRFNGQQTMLIIDG